MAAVEVEIVLSRAQWQVAVDVMRLVPRDWNLNFCLSAPDLVLSSSILSSSHSLTSSPPSSAVPCCKKQAGNAPSNPHSPRPHPAPPLLRLRENGLRNADGGSHARQGLPPTPMTYLSPSNPGRSGDSGIINACPRSSSRTPSHRDHSSSATTPTSTHTMPPCRA